MQLLLRWQGFDWIAVFKENLYTNLDLGGEVLLTWSVAPAVAQLTGLVHLSLRPEGETTPLCLQQLSVLSSLTHVSLPVGNLSEDDRRVFLASMRGLRDIQHLP